MKRLTALVFLTATLIVSSLSTTAQDNIDLGELRWKIVGVRNLLQTTGLDYGFFFGAVLAPDGSAIASSRSDEGLCLYSLADGRLTCYPWPEDFHHSTVPFLAWSADSAYLAFTEEWSAYLDPDIWLFEVATGTFTNRTDDGVSGSVLSIVKSFLVDYTPAWNPTDGKLYFFRSEVSPGISPYAGRYTLQRLSPTGGEPELVRDLTGELPGFSVYPEFGGGALDNRAEISPDGTRMAMIVEAITFTDSHNGVWILDLVNNSLTQSASLEDLRIGLPDWYDTQYLEPESLA